MNCRVLRVSYITLCLFTVQVTQAYSEDYSTFIRKYPREVAKIADTLKNVKGRIRLTTTLSDANGKAMKSTEDTGDFAVSGNSGKVVLNIHRAATGRRLDAVFVHCKTGDSFFSLSKKQGESEYAVEDYGNGSKKRIDYDIYFGRFLNAPFKFLNADLKSMFEGPNSETPKTKEIDRDGKRILSVSYGLKSNPNARFDFELDPSGHHRILQSSHRIDDKLMFRFLVEYDPNAKDSPIPRKVTYESGSEQVVCQFEDIKLEPTPEADFLPAFFGIPDFEIHTRQSRMPSYRMLLGSAAFVAIAIGFARRTLRPGLTK